jgi:hypothetical protein
MNKFALLFLKTEAMRREFGFEGGSLLVGKHGVFDMPQLNGTDDRN